MYPRLQTHRLWSVSRGAPHENFPAWHHLFLHLNSCLLLENILLAWVAQHQVLLDLMDVDTTNLGLVAIDDLGQLLKGWALGLDVHEVHEDELEENPALLSR